MKLPKFLMEHDMELFLEYNGYDITYGEEELIDSTKVCDHAADLGYESFMNDDGILEFILRG